MLRERGRFGAEDFQNAVNSVPSTNWQHDHRSQAQGAANFHIDQRILLRVGAMLHFPGAQALARDRALPEFNSAPSAGAVSPLRARQTTTPSFHIAIADPDAPVKRRAALAIAASIGSKRSSPEEIKSFKEASSINSSRLAD